MSKTKKGADALTKKLSEKAKESIYTVGDLRKVYKRGIAAYISSGSRNVSSGAWAMGRVNSFVSGRGGARKADNDIHAARKKTPKKR